MRWIRRIVVVGLVVVLVVVLAIWFNLNRIVHREIESRSTQSLQLETRLDAARVWPFRGRLELDGLRVASPKGFAAEQMLSVEDAGLTVTWGQLRSDPVRIGLMEIARPVMVIEQVEGRFNFRVLAELAERDPQDEPVHVIVDRLTIEDALVKVRPGIPGLAEEIEVRVPILELQEIGTAEQAAPISDVILHVLMALATEAAQSEKIPAQLRTLLAGDLRGAAERIVTERAQKIREKLRELPVPDVERGIEGLLRRPEKDNSSK